MWPHLCSLLSYHTPPAGGSVMSTQTLSPQSLLLLPRLFFLSSAGFVFLSLPVVVCSCGRYPLFPSSRTFKILINLRVFYVPAHKQLLCLINHSIWLILAVLCSKYDPHEKDIVAF